jgi:hypothetical protein
MLYKENENKVSMVLLLITTYYLGEKKRGGDFEVSAVLSLSIL